MENERQQEARRFSLAEEVKKALTSAKETWAKNCVFSKPDDEIIQEAVDLLMKRGGDFDERLDLSKYISDRRDKIFNLAYFHF